jgi:hypothetical protein
MREEPGDEREHGDGTIPQGYELEQRMIRGLIGCANRKL